jgi:hypothetical protein
MKILSILFPMGYSLRNGYWLIFRLSPVVLFLEAVKLRHLVMGLLSNNYGHGSFNCCPDNFYCAT